MSSLTVGQALGLRSFDGAELVAGKDGLSRKVSCAMVMEAADIDRWGKPGIMIITSFFALEPLSDEEREDFLRKLADVGPSCIVFKPERLLDNAPKDIVRFCDRNQVPLIRLDASTEYRVVLESVMGSVLDGNLMLLDRFFSIHQQTMRLSLSQPSLHVILDQMKKVISAECTFYNRDTGACISTSPNQAAITRLSLKETHRGRYQTFVYYQASFDTPMQSDQEALAVLVPNIEQAHAYLLVHGDVAKVAPVDVMAIESFVGLLQMELLQEHAVEQRVYRRNNAVVYDLLLGQYTSPAAANDALRELSFDANPLYQALLVRFRIKNPGQLDRKEELVRAFTLALKRAHYNVAYHENDERIVYLRNFQSDALALPAGRVAQILAQMHENPDLPEFTHLAALSEVVGRDKIPRAYDEVVGMSRLFQADQAHNHVISYDDLGIYKIFMAAKGQGDLTDFIDPRLARLRETSPTEFQTLLALADNNLNYAATAKQLYVHPKTISYRVNRAREVHGIDIRDADTFAQLVITSRIMTLVGRGGTV